MIRSPISRISSAPMPRDVTAGVPTRMPGRRVRRLRVERDLVLVDGDPDLVEERLGLACPSRRAASRRRASGGCRCRPRRPARRGRRASRRAIAAFSTVRRWSRRNSSPSASWNATALPAITCISGPPWTPGKTVLSIVARRAEPLTVGKVAGSTAGGSSRAAEDQPAARPAERLVGRRRDDVGVRERRGMDAGRDEARDVGHVDEQQRPDAVGDRGHPLEVDDPGVGRRAGDDQLRAGPREPGPRARRSRSARCPGGRRRRGPRTAGRRSSASCRGSGGRPGRASSRGSGRPARGR